MTGDGGGRSIVLDLRCLQDPNFANRGVGRHALLMLRHAPPNSRIVGLTDSSLPSLAPEVRDVLAATRANSYAVSWAGSPSHQPACVVMLSPMTHDPLFLARLLSDPAVLRAAVVHDFIPRRSPERYLPGPVQRLNYANALRWLARCDLFLPNSRSSGDDVAALLGVPWSAIEVTGCPLDTQFEALAAEERERPRHLLVLGGQDTRKNPHVVIRAHARSPEMQQGAGVPLVVAGNYAANDAQAFRAMAVAAGGRESLVEVPGHLPDAALVTLYRRAWAVVCPSRDEGFSIPVIEGMAAGSPCLASDIPAHAELVTDPDCRFPPEDEGVLRRELKRVMADAAWRSAILARQAEVWPRFRAQAVADRFWGALLRRLRFAAPAVLRRVPPRVALMTPLPPDRSGVADYTAAACKELGKLVDLHVFSETERPAPLPGAATVRPLSALPHVSHHGFDRVISVVGNSHFHTRIFEMLLRYGAACIAHDARMLGFYRVLLGQQRALRVASQELGRPVTEAELNIWLGDEGKLEALFLGEIVESASPTIVHSPVTARKLHERFGVEPVYLPFCIYRPWCPDELTPKRRAAARERLGIADGEVAIATFGYVQAGKAPAECIWALDVLRDWGIPASLHFVGGLEPDGPMTTGLVALVAELGLESQVHFAEGYVSEQVYRDYLLGADLAVQLRTYGLGGLSGAVLDCAAAGLPTVTNESLAAAVGVPDYVRSIPDALSPLLLAEAWTDLRGQGLCAERPESARRAYSEQRSFRTYSLELCQALGLDVRSLGYVRQADEILPTFAFR
jgi:glycosyltransferase involved in cell wall biosynthesis